MAKQIYQFAIVGMSGKGKTMSFRNMDPETTGFINIENKLYLFAARQTNRAYLIIS